MPETGNYYPITHITLLRSYFGVIYSSPVRGAILVDGIWCIIAQTKKSPVRGAILVDGIWCIIAQTKKSPVRGAISVDVNVIRPARI